MSDYFVGSLGFERGGENMVCDALHQSMGSWDSGDEMKKRIPERRKTTCSIKYGGSFEYR